MKFLFTFFSLILSLEAKESCSFSYSVYNAKARKSIRLVQKSIDKAKLGPEYSDSIGCTICEEDQVHVVLNNGLSFKVCHKIAKDVTFVLNQAIKNGFPISKILGYWPQMSRGKMDRFGNRTKLSNHSFGSAIDINPDSNGLYENCVRWGPLCRLRMGGKWAPESNQASIKRSGNLVKSMNKIGLLWGGNLVGRQKDFMHFSLKGN